MRAELCREAKLRRHAAGPSTRNHSFDLCAAALMCLDAVRLPARVDSSGNLSSLFDQDRSQWDQELISEGLELLDLSATGPELTEYHVEAAIASIHARARRVEDTDWKAIVSLYDTLMTMRASPIVALNRAIAIAQNEGPERGLEEIGAITDSHRLTSYPFYFAALGELHLHCGRHATAHEHFRTALALARNPMERRFLDERLRSCEGADTSHVTTIKQFSPPP